MRLKATLFTILISMLSLQCSEKLLQVQKEIVVQRAAKLKSYHGVITERDSYNQDIKSEVWYRQSDFSFFAKVLSPRGFIGDSIMVHKGRTRIYFANARFGLEFYGDNFVPEAGQVLNYLEKEFDWHVKHYNVSTGERSELAGIPVVELQYQPKEEFVGKIFIGTWRTRVFENYSFPMSVELMNMPQVDKGYSFAFEKVEFNLDYDDEAFQFQFPRGTTIGYYNLGQAAISESAAKSRANFRLQFPGFEKLNVKRQGIYPAQGLIPAFTTVYRNNAEFIYFNAVRDYQLNLANPRGLKIKGKFEYNVQFAGFIKSIFWKDGATLYTVVSNLPLSDLITIIQN